MTRIARISAIAVVLGIAACTAGPTSTPVRSLASPVAVARALFDAMNRGDMSLAASYWAPDASGRFARNVPPPNEFQNVTCHSGPRFNGEPGDTDTDAGVSCEFEIREMWGGFEAGHSQWGVFLRRQAPGPWQLYEWGQG